MTHFNNSRGTLTLILGDLITYLFSLVLTLTLRYGQIPGRHLVYEHLLSFSILAILFVLVNFSLGLYDKQHVFLQGRVRGLLIQAQIINILIGITFFYFAPVSIAPKANLAIFFIVSTLALFIWRMIMFPVFSVSRKQVAIMVGKGDEVQDIVDEIGNGSGYGLNFREHVLPGNSVNETVKSIEEAVRNTGAGIIVANLNDKMVESAMPFLYSLIFKGLQVIDAGRLYETIFDRVPVLMVGERWFIENSSSALGKRRLYDVTKRLMDILFGLFFGTISLVFYPFVYIAIKLEDRGPIFITQERVGKNGKIVKIVKFRSMSGNDNGKYGANGTTPHVVTRVGKFIRVSRIDELPQFWNIIKGDISLIGPRPEFPSLVQVYEKEIPYYNARHLVKPGISGWAQIYHENHPHHSAESEETRNKLSYDLYYIKNRSLVLDLKIALRTFQILLKRSGK